MDTAVQRIKFHSHMYKYHVNAYKNVSFTHFLHSAWRQYIQFMQQSRGTWHASREANDLCTHVLCNSSRPTFRWLERSAGAYVHGCTVRRLGCAPRPLWRLEERLMNV